MAYKFKNVKSDDPRVQMGKKISRDLFSGEAINMKSRVMGSPNQKRAKGRNSRQAVRKALGEY